MPPIGAAEPVAGQPRRAVSRPMSYAEPSLSSKLRQGDTFFGQAAGDRPAAAEQADASPAAASHAEGAAPDTEPPAARTRSKTWTAAKMGAICHMLCTSAAVADGGISARKTAGMKFPLETLSSLKNFAIERIVRK